MAVGESVYLPHAEIPYDLHRYRDGWHAFWKSPPNGQIGRFFVTREELSAFLDGKWTVGRSIRNLLGLRRYLNEPDAGAFLSWRPDNRARTPRRRA